MKKSTPSSTAREVFIDTSGFYALLVAADEQHPRAAQILKTAAGRHARFLTTDYVLDETVTLLVARGHRQLIAAFLRTTLDSSACRIEWTEAARFSETAAFLLKHQDHPWSFTDCLSFVVMKELHLREALTKDVNFEQAGFVSLLR
jgi:predicted nucleic acid-binding protein